MADSDRQAEDGADAEDLGVDALGGEVYDELRRIAAHYLQSERVDHTLQPTALVHEAYVRMAGGRLGKFADRAHFVATGARVMRRILVDHARAHKAQKRGGGRKAPLEIDFAAFEEGRVVDMLAMDDALRRLEGLHPRQARVVELRFFGGLSVEDSARLLEVSERTVEGDWSVARAWLKRELRAGDER